MSKKTKKQKTIAPQPKYDKYEGCVAAIVMTEEAKHYARFNVFHSLRINWLKNLLSSVLVLIVAIFALYREELVTAIVFFVLTPLFPFILVLIQYLSVKSRLSSDSLYGTTSREYVFYDEYIAISSKEGKRETARDAERYDSLWRVFERKDAFYVYVDEKSAFVVSKDCIVSGDEEKLKAHFEQKLGDRFKARRK